MSLRSDKRLWRHLRSPSIGTLPPTLNLTIPGYTTYWEDGSDEQYILSKAASCPGCPLSSLLQTHVSVV